jgi:hypothetical protein
MFPVNLSAGLLGLPQSIRRSKAQDSIAKHTDPDGHMQMKSDLWVFRNKGRRLTLLRTRGGFGLILHSTRAEEVL